MGKTKDGKGGKGGKGGGAAPSPMEEWVSRARGIGLLAGFAISFWVCHRQGFPMADAVLRGLVGAAVLSVVAWWSALLVIQALMRAAAAQTRREAELAAHQAAATQQQADASFARSGPATPAPDEAG